MAAPGNMLAFGMAASSFPLPAHDEKVGTARRWESGRWAVGCAGYQHVVLVLGYIWEAGEERGGQGGGRYRPRGLERHESAAADGR